MKKRGLFAGLVMLIFCMTLLIPILGSVAVTAHAADRQSIGQNIIVENLTLQTFTNNNFTGSTVNKGDIYKDAIYLIAEYPGARVTKDGYVVYADSMTLSFCATTSEDEKIEGSNRRINYSTATQVSKSFLGEPGMLDLGKQVGNGFVYITRDTAAGGKEPLAPLYDIFKSSGMKRTNLPFLMEGDYNVTIFFETYEWGGFLGLSKKDFLSHQLSYKFKIRRSDSKIALIDNEIKNGKINYIQKNTITNSEDITIDYNKNAYITASYVYTDKNGVKSAPTTIASGGKITKSGTYEFTIQNDTFITELFSVKIDADAVVGVFSNLRKITSMSEAEAEMWVSLTWDDNYHKPAFVYCTVSFNGGPEVNYVKNSTLQVAGVYRFTLSKYSNVGALMFTTKYTITVVPSDDPTLNQDILMNPYRFNNFISKWYQVYDFKNNRIICLANEEEAYEAAMTLEFYRVTTKTLTNASMFKDFDKLAPGEIVAEGKYYTYYNEFEKKELIYFSNTALTKAMNKNAKNNSNLAYYDMLSPPIQMEFDKSLFTKDHYINKDFVFASPHPAIIESMTFYFGDSEEGTTVYYEFDTYNGVGYIEASKYFTEHGTYNITERDNLGNWVSYTVICDLKAPDVFISLDDGESFKAVDGQTYNVSKACFNSFFDDLDNQAVIKIGDKYFTQDKLDNFTLTKAGIYEVYAYDRSGNIIHFYVVIDGEMDCEVEGDTDGSEEIRVYVNPFITDYEIKVNGTNVTKTLIYDAETDSYYLLFESGNKDAEVEMILYNKLDGSDTKAFSFNVQALSQAASGGSNNNNGTGGDNGSGDSGSGDTTNGSNILLYLGIAGGAVIILAGIGFFIFIKRRA